MLFRSFCFLLVCGAVLAEAQSEEVTECNPKACQKSDNQKMVCGSDGLTYPNRCMLERVRCKNNGVVMAKRGPCRRQRSCTEWQDLSLDFPQYQFKSRCKRNGSYEPGQCHPETDYCWCVTSDGLPISSTVKPKNTKPGSKPIRCGGGGKKKMTRSPTRQRIKSRNCRNPDRREFNKRLLDSFQSEYVREFRRNGTDEDVLRWKFGVLDANRDQELDKREYRELKRLVAKAIKPKKCARLFPKCCELQIDDLITMGEWLACLPRDGFHADANSSDTESDTSEDDDQSSIYDPSGLIGEPSDTPQSDLSDDDPISETGGWLGPSVTPHGCFADRKLALEEARLNGNVHNATYIPECTQDDRFKKIQCYGSVGYCWCVNEDDGTTIPGTSVKGEQPNCNILKPTLKPMKGCLEEKRIVFLRELMPFFETKVKQALNLKNPADLLNRIQNDPELASFNLLDKNRNKILERTEWKTFKEMVAQVKGLKKCGKKLPRYCDSNKDKQISLTEWRECLRVPGGQSTVSMNQRLGKTNPLKMLKHD